MLRTTIYIHSRQNKDDLDINFRVEERTSIIKTKTGVEAGLCFILGFSCYFFANDNTKISVDSDMILSVSLYSFNPSNSQSLIQGADQHIYIYIHIRIYIGKHKRKRKKEEATNASIWPACILCLVLTTRPLLLPKNKTLVLTITVIKYGNQTIYIHIEPKTKAQPACLRYIFTSSLQQQQHIFQSTILFHSL